MRTISLWTARLPAARCSSSTERTRESARSTPTARAPRPIDAGPPTWLRRTRSSNLPILQIIASASPSPNAQTCSFGGSSPGLRAGETAPGSSPGARTDRARGCEPPPAVPPRPLHRRGADSDGTPHTARWPARPRFGRTCRPDRSAIGGAMPTHAAPAVASAETGPATASPTHSGAAGAGRSPSLGGGAVSAAWSGKSPKGRVRADRTEDARPTTSAIESREKFRARPTCPSGGTRRAAGRNSVS
jgi:hypothetical protein